MSIRLATPADLATTATALSLDTPAQTTPGAPIHFIGTYQGNPQALDYNLGDGTGWIQAANPSFTNGTFSFDVAGSLVANSYTLQVRDHTAQTIASSAGNFVVSAWTPQTLASSPGASAVFEFNPNGIAGVSGSAVSAIADSVDPTQSLVARLATSAKPIALADTMAGGSDHRLLQFQPTLITPDKYDPTTNWLSAGGIGGPAGKLVTLADSTNLKTSGSFTTIIALDLNSTYYEAGPIWGAPAVPGPLNYIQLRQNPGSGFLGANLADSLGTAGQNAEVKSIPQGFHVLTMIKGNGTLTYRLDGQQLAQVPITTTDSFKSTDFLIGGGFAPAVSVTAAQENGVPPPYVGEFQAYGGMLSGSDLANAEKLAGNSVGLTLNPVIPPPGGPAMVAVAQPATLLAGQDIFHGIVTAGSPGQIKFAWHASPSGETATASDMVVATRQSDGSYTATLTIDHLGTVGYFYVAVDGVVSRQWSATPVSAPPPVGAPTIALSAPGTVQESSAGAGVTITETVSTTGLAGPIYEEVLTATGAIETPYAAVALSQGSAATVLHLAHSGDTIQATDSLTAPTVTTDSAPVTITDPAPPPSGGPATVTVARPATLVAGLDRFSGTVAGGTPGVVKFAWHASPSGESANASDMVLATRQADGTYAASLTIDHVGQTGYFYVAVDGVVSNEWNIVPVSTPPSPGTPTIALSAPGSAQEASVGAGVDVAEQITTSNLAGPVYLEVLTATGAIETPYSAISLTNGAAAPTVHFAHSGDFVQVVDSLSAPTVTQDSSAITITDPAPPPSGGPAAVTVARPATLVAGLDRFSGTVAGGTPSVVKFAWHASPSGENANASDMVLATRQADGTYAASLTVDHAGQTGYFYVAVDGVVTDEWNIVPVSTPPSPGTPTIALSAPGSAQEAAVGAGVDVAEQITTGNLAGPVYLEVLTASGAIETPYSAISLTNGAAAPVVHFAHTGDFVQVVDNLAAPKVTQDSSAITITDPAPPGAGPAVVTVPQPATLVAGMDSFTGTVTSGTPGLVKFGWHGPYGETASAADLVTATKQANGTYTATLNVDHPGTTSYFYVDVDGVVTREWSLAPQAPVAGSSAAPSLAAASHSVAGAAALDMAASASSPASASVLPYHPAITGGSALPLPGTQTAMLAVPDHLRIAT